MKKRLLVSICVCLLLILFLGIGVSYSLWNISVSEDKINTAMTSCFDITYSSESEAINLEKQYPIGDEIGSKLEPYTFKITNNCGINAYYKINLETLSSSKIDTKFMKASLNNENPKTISNYETAEISLKNGKVANTLKSGYLPVGGSVTFNLRVWIDYDTTVDDVKNDGTDKWIGKLVVISSPVTEDEINKVCQNNGGDLIDSGECRKYYVKLNNYVSMKNIRLGNETSDIHGTFDETTETWSINYSGTNKWFGIEIEPIEEKYRHVFYGTLTANGISGYLAAEFCGVDGGSRGCAYPRVALQSKDNNKYSYYFNLVNHIDETTIKNYNGYLLYIPYPEIDSGTLSETYFLKEYMIIDLTLMFGEGNEPNKEWCDKYLNDYYEYNSEGTLVPIKEIGEPVKTSYYDVINL